MNEILLNIDCSIHRTPVDVYGTCKACREEALDRHKAWCAEKKIDEKDIWLTLPNGPDSVLVNGIEVQCNHETTYLEMCIPVDLKNVLTAFIKKQCKMFEHECSCLACQRERANKKESNHASQ